MYSLQQASREIFNMPYPRLRRKLIELEWLVRFKEIEIITNHDYLTYKHGRICFTIEGIEKFSEELFKDYMDKYKGGN